MEKGFASNQTNNVTKKLNSKLSNTNISYHLKFQIPKMYRQFFRIISQNPENVETSCYDLNNPFRFACRK